MRRESFRLYGVSLLLDQRSPFCTLPSSALPDRRALNPFCLDTLPSHPNHVTVIWSGWNRRADRQTSNRETAMKKMFPALVSSAMRRTTRKMAVASAVALVTAGTAGAVQG